MIDLSGLPCLEYVDLRTVEPKIGLGFDVATSKAEPAKLDTISIAKLETVTPIKTPPSAVAGWPEWKIDAARSFLLQQQGTPPNDHPSQA